MAKHCFHPAGVSLSYGYFGTMSHEQCCWCGQEAQVERLLRRTPHPDHGPHFSVESHEVVRVLERFTGADLTSEECRAAPPMD